jgi:hypothetical protein
MTLDRGAIERGGLDPARLGQQHLLEAGREHRPVGRGGEAPRAEDALKPERPHHGDPLPSTALLSIRPARHPGPARRAGSRHGGGPGWPAPRPHRGAPGAPGRSRRCRAAAPPGLGRPRPRPAPPRASASFSRVSPRRRRARPPVQGSTRTPISSASRSRCSAKRGWLSAATRRRSVASPSSRSVGRGPPVERHRRPTGLASSRPSPCAASTQRWTVERPTANRTATASAGWPPSSAAATTRWRRSAEQGLGMAHTASG